MKSPDEHPLLTRLRATEAAACLGMLAQLCRLWPSFRAWLWQEFARDPFVRERMAALVDDKEAVPPSNFVELSEAGVAWRKEQERLRMLRETKPYGGLSLTQVETLIRRFQAGHIDLGVFLLVQRWQEAGAASPPTMWAGLHLLDMLLPARDWHVHNELRHAFTFHRHFGTGRARRAAFSRADWWKTQLLWYVYSHPRESYRTGEFRRHLATLGVEVSPKEIRRFCKRCGLRRDERGGRPRTRPAKTVDHRRREFQTAAPRAGKSTKAKPRKKASNAGA